MSCNGHNHAPDCNCGWGGVFYQSNGLNQYAPGYWRREGSYSNPNARCPVCGDAVFFYRSPDNGRVFFDHPGPPWPKHPCTSGAPRVASDLQEKPRKRHKRFKVSSGWFPFPCKAIVQVDGTEVTGLVNTQDRTLFTLERLGRIDVESPIWARRSSDGSGAYEISYLWTRKGLTQFVTCLAYVSLERLFAGEEHDTDRAPSSVGGVPTGVKTSADVNKSSAGRGTLHLEKHGGAYRQGSAKKPGRPKLKQKAGQADAKRQGESRTLGKSGRSAADPVGADRPSKSGAPTAMELAFGRAKAASEPPKSA